MGDLTLQDVKISGNLVVLSKDGARITLRGCTLQNLVVLSHSIVGLRYRSAAGISLLSEFDGLRWQCQNAYHRRQQHDPRQIRYRDGFRQQCHGPEGDGDRQPDAGRPQGQLRPGWHGEGGHHPSQICHPLRGGYAEHILVHGKGYTITCKYGKLDEELDRGLTGTKLTLSSGQTVSSTAPTVTITATVTGVNTGYGAESNARSCTLRWYSGRQSDPVPEHLHPGGDDEHVSAILIISLTACLPLHRSRLS